MGACRQRSCVCQTGSRRLSSRLTGRAASSASNARRSQSPQLSYQAVAPLPLHWAASSAARKLQAGAVGQQSAGMAAELSGTHPQALCSQQARGCCGQQPEKTDSHLGCALVLCDNEAVEACEIPFAADSLMLWWQTGARPTTRPAASSRASCSSSRSTSKSCAASWLLKLLRSANGRSQIVMPEISSQTLMRVRGACRAVKQAAHQHDMAAKQQELGHALSKQRELDNEIQVSAPCRLLLGCSMQ